MNFLLAKNKLLKNTFVNSLASKCYRFIMFNLIKGKHFNKIQFNNSYLSHCKIVFNGKNNLIEFDGTTMFNNCTFNIVGNNNKIIIKDLAVGYHTKFNIEDNNNQIIVGKKTAFAGATELACIEGTNIIIGDNCLFSSEVDIRTGDSHSVFDNQKKRINKSIDIEIGNHVWCGRRSTLLKGAKIQNNCIVAAGAIVTNAFCEKNCILAGVPAKIVKKDINWLHERV